MPISTGFSVIDLAAKKGIIKNNATDRYKLRSMRRGS